MGRYIDEREMSKIHIEEQHRSNEIHPLQKETHQFAERISPVDIHKSNILNDSKWAEVAAYKEHEHQQRVGPLTAFIDNKLGGVGKERGLAIPHERQATTILREPIVEEQGTGQVHHTDNHRNRIHRRLLRRTLPHQHLLVLGVVL